MLLSKPFLISWILFSSLTVVAQENAVNFQQDYRLAITKTAESIKLDGDFTESARKQAETNSPFWKKFPNDEGRPKRNTDIRITYDDKFLYIAVTASIREQLLFKV